MKNKPCFYSIGHSNRSIKDFLDILIQEKIELLVDVRSLPGSNKFPQFNKENLLKTLEENHIKYEHIKTLGGLRKNNQVSSDINAYWQNKSFHNYADYAMSEEFKEGLNQLITLGKKYKTAFMCAEILWWRCHRRIITDYLLAMNMKVYHIFDLKNKKEAIITPEAIINNNNSLSYPEINLN